MIYCPPRRTRDLPTRKGAKDVAVRRHSWGLPDRVDLDVLALSAGWAGDGDPRSNTHSMWRVFGRPGPLLAGGPTRRTTGVADERHRAGDRAGAVRAVGRPA